jgi:putative peptidoglycan lipid II flippase
MALALPPLVSLLGFDAEGISLVVWTARAFLLGLTGHTLLEVAVRAFYAQQDARTPLWAALGMLALFVITAALLAPQLGAPGIALGNTLAFTLQAGVLLVLLNRRYPGLLSVGGPLLRASGGVVVGGLAAFVITSGVLLPASALPGPALLGHLILAGAALVLGGGLALPFIWPEMKLLLKL